MLPSTWEYQVLRDLGDPLESTIQTGPFGAQLHSSDYVDEGVPFILIKNIQSGYVDTQDMPRISSENAERLAQYSLRAGDVVFSRVGRVGSCFLVTEAQDGWIISGQLLRVRVHRRHADPRFLLHWLMSAGVQDFIQGASVGTTRQSINTQILGAVPVPRIPQAEQGRIAGILDTLDDAIRKTDEIIAKLQQMKEGLLHDLLTRGIDENGQLRDPERHPEQFKESVVGRIPGDWDLVPVGEVAAAEPGSTTIGPFGSNLVASDYRSEGIPVVFVRDVREHGFAWQSNVYVSPVKANELRAHSVRSGDVIATKMGLPPCLAAVYPDWMPDGVVTADIIRVRLDREKALANWVVLYLNGPAVRAQVRKITGGVTRPKVTLTDFRRLLVALPTPREQMRIIKGEQHVSTRLTAESARLSKLRLLKNGLADDLLTGRVRVRIPEEASA